MVKTRTPLGSLASAVNVGGPDYLRRRAGRERTAVERQTRRMRERREETWRLPLTRQRVVAFCELFLRCMVWTENGEREGRPHPEIVEQLLHTLTYNIITWVDMHRVWTYSESLWPMTLEHFKEIDNDLELYLPRVHAGSPWQRIRRYFAEVEVVQLKKLSTV